MEHADEILVGLDLLMKGAKVERGYIGIEDNKPEAIKLFEQKTANDPRIEIVALAKKYPQGGEKQLVDAVINRQVPAPPAIPVCLKRHLSKWHVISNRIKITSLKILLLL